MANGKPDDLPPHVQVIQMGRAYVVARTVYAAAKLGLADQFASEPKSAAQLAGSMQLHAPSWSPVLVVTSARLDCMTIATHLSLPDS